MKGKGKKCCSGAVGNSCCSSITAQCLLAALFLCPFGLHISRLNRTALPCPPTQIHIYVYVCVSAYTHIPLYTHMLHKIFKCILFFCKKVNLVRKYVQSVISIQNSKIICLLYCRFSGLTLES